jgi:putative nucleotidyltransferase with HDIG domain
MAYGAARKREGSARECLERERLAQSIIALREAIADAIVTRSIKPERRTIAIDLLVDEFVDAFAAAVCEDAWHLLDAWAETACTRRPGSATVRAVVASAIDVGIATVEAWEPGRFAPLAPRLAAARSAAERIARKPRSVTNGAGSDTIDEIDVLIEDFIMRLDEADAQTAEHSRAVSAWSARLARRLGLAPADAAYVTRGGLIHDVGKSTTPREILLAPRRLDERETALMRDHVIAGERLVLARPALRVFAPVVRSHHERFDGMGYPDNRPGAELPMAVRIVTVADAFNAMIGRRPYRGPFSPALALDELKRNRGTHFDPVVVDALIEILAGATEPRALLV